MRLKFSNKTFLVSVFYECEGVKASQNETSNFVALAARRPDTDAVRTVCSQVGHENVSPAVRENRRAPSIYACSCRSALEREHSKSKCRLLGVTVTCVVYNLLACEATSCQV